MKVLFGKIGNFLSSLHQFLTRDIWRQDFSKISTVRKIFYQQIIIGYLVVRSYIEDRLPVRAAALVYSTLLAVFPLLAITFALLRGFDYHLKLEPQLLEWAEPFGEQVTELVPRVIKAISEVDLTLFPILGVAVLIISIFSIVNTIERAFNDIWRIQKLRSIHRRFADLTGVFFFIPLLIIGVPVINTYLQSIPIVHAMTQNPGTTWIIKKSTPLALSLFVFFFLYIVIPNTKVRWDSAFFGALIAGIGWQIANFYFTKFLVLSFQTGFKGALYSSFASLPLLLIWLYLAWTVVLLGAEISYAHQNQSKMTWEVRRTKYSFAFKENISLHILLFIYEKFQRGQTAAGHDEIKDYFHVPERLINEIISILVDLRFIYALDSDEKDSRYTPAMNPEKLTVRDVLSGIRSHGASAAFEKNGEKIHSIVERLEKDYNNIMDRSFAARSIKELLQGPLKQTTSSA
ncbi:YihY/virulence factor BrkB family protein [candidate division KSB1 bacterium]|nr:YihY/virulence factor BrkB family protein [candidate division KSB1 bacterium]